MAWILQSQTSFVSAITIPSSTKTTIATCIHIQVGDMLEPAYLDRAAREDEIID